MRDFSPSQPDTPGWHNLTCREWEVLLMLADDHDHRSIAAKICVSDKSVKNYCNRIGDELGQKGPQVLARHARRNRCLVREMYQRHTGRLPPLKVTFINYPFHWKSMR